MLVGALDKNSAANGSAVYRRVLSGMMAHPRFQLTPRGALSYDFVLFRIDSVQGYGGIRCIELNEDPVATQPGRQVKIVGFGALVWNGTESERLMTASVSTIDTEECERRYGRKPGFLDESVTCTLGSGTTTCYGDSGGPVVDSSGRLIGITSFGTTCKSLLGTFRLPPSSLFFFLTISLLRSRLRPYISVRKRQRRSSDALDQGDGLRPYEFSVAVLFATTDGKSHHYTHGGKDPGHSKSVHQYPRMR